MLPDAADCSASMQFQIPQKMLPLWMIPVILKLVKCAYY
jgi:hypothetical protein